MDNPADSYRSAADIEQIVMQFESCTLPRKAWTHRAHVTVAVWYLSRQEQPEAIRSIRRSIRRYNESCGIAGGAGGGYHETITMFYMRVLRLYLDGLGAHASLVERTNAAVHRFGAGNLPLEYYSPERLMSPQARAQWVEPDLKPLE